ncbi:Alpha/Beta hydrolase protein [Trichoderma austrokoningii]
MRFQSPFTALVLGSVVASSPATTHPKCNISQYTDVPTTSGLITGHVSSNSDCVVEFLGVPYAQPPVGQLRFEAPAKLNANSKSFIAAKYAADCPHATNVNIFGYPGFTPQGPKCVEDFLVDAGTPQSEDCLYLNIWTKSTNVADAAKPVLVFFFGGGFNYGGTDTAFYNGKYFAGTQNVVVVTINYRIDVFGFPGAPGQPANLGLRDQRVGVEWVRDNIAAFGGNSDKITIFGQSVGGEAVDFWAYAYQQDPIVSGLIAHSGNTFSFPLNSAITVENNWNAIVSGVNCTSSKDQLACVKQVDWQDILAISETIRPLPSDNFLRTISHFTPFPDEEIVFSDYINRTMAGNFAKLPVMLGNTNNEDGFYRLVPYAQTGLLPTSQDVTDFLLESFTCPVTFQASARRSHRVPAWAFRYMADWDNTRLYSTNSSTSGAYHMVDLHMIFGASEDVTGLPTTEGQRNLTKIMQTAWASFADDPVDGLTALGWPQFDQSEDSYILLGEDNIPSAQFVAPSDWNAPCSTVTFGIYGTSIASPLY